MARLYISEYKYAVTDTLRQPVGAPMEPALRDQVVEIGALSTLSVAFKSETTFVVVSCDAPCSLAFGDKDIEATQDNKRLGTGECRPFGVRPGMYLAVIEND